jgi:hypothetical protein
MKNVYKMYVGKPEKEIPFWRTKRRWKDMIKIKMDLKESGCQGID